MGFDHRRTVTFRLAQAAHAYRVRSGSRLARIELHSGQENLLKALDEKDGQSMSDLAAVLGVQPPTITKMISRLAAQDYVERRTSTGTVRPAAAKVSTSRMVRSGSAARAPFPGSVSARGILGASPAETAAPNFADDTVPVADHAAVVATPEGEPRYTRAAPGPRRSCGSWRRSTASSTPT